MYNKQCIDCALFGECERCEFADDPACVDFKETVPEEPETNK